MKFLTEHSDTKSIIWFDLLESTIIISHGIKAWEFKASNVSEKFLISSSLQGITIDTTRIFFKTKKIYDTKDLVGKPIPLIDLKLLNSEKTFKTSDLKKNDFTLINLKDLTKNKIK